ncbi:MAG: P-loop NTPase [Nitrososphaerota archaeon]|nr:P-loop NTPase [Nitrososphaerota archaeon]MDG6939373.1 P-loop NTPase [Nitrososphaerota archaeon]
MYVNSTIAEGKAEKIGSVVLVGSGKGGVGKSALSVALARCLAASGARAGLLDADVHGSAMASLPGLKAAPKAGKEGVAPADWKGIAVMSAGMFADGGPVPVTGEDRRSLVTSLFASTDWGEVDFLVVDMPAGTGDEAMSLFRTFGGKARLLLVSQPSELSLAATARLAQLAKAEGVECAGAVLNMASKKGPFGKESAASAEKRLGCKVLAEVPFVEGAEGELAVGGLEKEMEPVAEQLAGKPSARRRPAKKSRA